MSYLKITQEKIVLFIYLYIYNINKEYFEYNGKKIPKTKLTKPFKLKSTCLEEDLMCYIRNILS